ncbi:MAG TPA: hypothetical protein DCX65_08175 [Spirochaetaceae bacterium]|nr:hypothetical protein [Spirochaetaceae bacterium]
MAERQHLSAARERAESDVQAALAELQRGQTGQASLLGGRRHEDLLREKEDLHRRQLLESRIASLEDERRALRAGQPCPLCGAVDHPWSELTQSDILGATLSAAKLPAELPFEDDLAARLDQVNRLLEAARLAEGRVATQAARLQETRLALAERDSALAVSDNQSGQLAARLASLQTEQNAAATHSTELVAGIERDLMALGDQPGSAEVAAAGGHNATDHKATDYGAAIRRLKARLQAWQAGRQRLEVLEASLQESGKRQALVQASLDRVDGELPVASSALVSAIEDADRLSSQRAALYGNKDVTVGEAELERAAAVAATAATTARQRWQETQDSLLRLRGQAHDLAASLDQRRPDLEAARVALDASLARLGFATEADGSADAGSVADAACLACRLPPLERRRLQERQADLQQRQAGLDSLNADLSRRLAAQSVRQLSPLTAVALAAARDEIAQAQQAATERSTELRLRLEADDGNAALANQKRNSLTGLQAEEARWTSLDDLIGSADGKKYNKFAQHLTLRGLIELSNRKLALFSDRYRLVPNDEANLEFDIIDEWQAGEIRSTRNLSGGESFLVSLALALGLADLSSRHASLDSLFLDEGFGTLDEESLESALGTLAALRTEGKLIGVISHVPAIRERIATHIEVRPLSGGRSRLEGPGVSYKNIT